MGLHSAAPLWWLRTPRPRRRRSTSRAAPSTAALQRRDADLDGWVGGEELEHPGAAIDAEGFHLVGQTARLKAAEARQRGDHRLRGAEQTCRAGVGAKFALARKPGDDHRGEDAEHDLAHDHRNVEPRTDAALG